MDIESAKQAIPELKALISELKKKQSDAVSTKQIQSRE